MRYVLILKIMPRSRAKDKCCHKEGGGGGFYCNRVLDLEEDLRQLFLFFLVNKGAIPKQLKRSSVIIDVYFIFLFEFDAPSVHK